MARLTQNQLDQAFKQGGSSTDAYENAVKRRQDAEQAQAQRDAALSQLIKGHELADASKNAMYDKQLEVAKDLRSQYGQEANIDAGEVKIGGVDPLNALLKRRELSQPKLTPAQTASETAAGKKIADYETAGGRATSAKNIEQVGSVENDLKTGKRDLYDRKVGGLLNSFPSLMGAFAPAEKARRDKAYNAAMMLARQSDPNPTENQIRNIMGQIYDPSSDDATNLERIQRFQQQQRGVDADMAQSAANLRSTGYAMPGLSKSSPAPAQPPVQSAPTHSMRSPSPAPQASTGLEHLSDAELAAMAAKLGIK